MKKFGFIRVNPSDYVIRFRNGKIYKEGRGMNFFCQFGEQYVIIPSIVSHIPFVADQITIENQGVEVSGFAIWKIGEASKIYLHFDFSKEEKPIEEINDFLKEVVESAIRHMVANMTIEEVLRKRGSIILQLKKELEYISNQWSIVIETIEIKNVKILSSQLFSNMQAKFRDSVRLESETSLLKTEQEIAEQRIHHKEKIAGLEQEARRIEFQRKLELESLEVKQKSELSRLKMEEQRNEKMIQMSNELKIFEQSEENKIKMSNIQKETLESQKELEKLKSQIEMEKKKAEILFMKMDLEVEKERIEIGNLEDNQQLLYKKLPEVAEALKINELNLGSDNLNSIINGLSQFLKKK